MIDKQFKELIKFVNDCNKDHEDKKMNDIELESFTKFMYNLTSILDIYLDRSENRSKESNSYIKDKKAIDNQFNEFVKFVNNITKNLYANAELSEKLLKRMDNYIKNKYEEISKNTIKVNKTTMALLVLQALTLMILIFNLFC